MIDAGYVASEVHGTVVVDAERNLALPLLENVFFEFVPVRGLGMRGSATRCCCTSSARLETTISWSRRSVASCAIT